MSTVKKWRRYDDAGITIIGLARLYSNDILCEFLHYCTFQRIKHQCQTKCRPLRESYFAISWKFRISWWNVSTSCYQGTHVQTKEKCLQDICATELFQLQDSQFLEFSVVSAPSVNCFKHRLDKHCDDLKFSSTLWYVVSRSVNRPLAYIRLKMMMMMNVSVDQVCNSQQCE